MARFFARCPPKDLDVGNDIAVRLPGGLFEADVLVWRPVARRDFIAIVRARLAIDVADSFLARDRDVKAPDHGRAGLAELWIVDLNARVRLVYRLGTRAPPKAGRNPWRLVNRWRR